MKIVHLQNIEFIFLTSSPLLVIDVGTCVKLVQFIKANANETRFSVPKLLHDRNVEFAPQLELLLRPNAKLVELLVTLTVYVPIEPNVCEKPVVLDIFVSVIPSPQTIVAITGSVIPNRGIVTSVFPEFVIKVKLAAAII